MNANSCVSIEFSAANLKRKFILCRNLDIRCVTDGDRVVSRSRCLSHGQFEPVAILLDFAFWQFRRLPYDELISLRRIHHDPKTR